MAATKYTFSISADFPNQEVAADRLELEIKSAAEIVVGLDYITVIGDTCDIWFKDALSPAGEVKLQEIVAAHSGEPLDQYDKIEVINKVDLAVTNRSNKLEVHESSRVRGTTTYFTGAGDNINDITDVGNGEMFILKHRIADPFEQHLYIDFNIVENETWIHEGYVIWHNAQFDTISFTIIPITTNYTVSSGTNYNLYGGYLVVPAAGDGTIQVTSDITDPRGGLVYIPISEDGVRHTPAFWNAEWNSTTKKYENITAAPYGNGEYNMFTVEVPLGRFVNRLPLLGQGFQRMQSADSDEIGQGMRLRATLYTTDPDHDWEMACMLTLHRAHTV